MEDEEDVMVEDEEVEKVSALASNIPTNRPTVSLIPFIGGGCGSGGGGGKSQF